MAIGGIGGKDGSDSFCDTPMPSEFNKGGSVPKGSSGTYDGDPCGPFGSYRRTGGSSGPAEKIFDKTIPAPSGESDQY